MMHTLVQQGWQCPCCQKIYSPTTPMCFYCPPKVEQATGTGVNAHACREQLRMLGKAYPRTCVICGITGPCVHPVKAQEST